MTPAPLQPARIEWADDGTPLAPDFSDRYHGHAGALVQAQHVFLAGNDLPRRWQGRDDFTIVETGFGLGHNFLATWQAWRDDPQRCRRLHHVALDAYPPTRAELQRAHATARPAPAAELAAALQAAWPPRVPGLHLLLFDGGAVRLLLALGDVHEVLPQWQVQADAFYLDGFAPDRNPRMWDRDVLNALARRAAPDATLATWSVAHALRDGLAATGFRCELHPGVGGKREVLRAVHAPRHRLPRREPPTDRRALVVGAGLAGACAAASLAAQGFEVTVFERAPAPASATSGNPAGMFHATVHRDDGPYARLFRAGALHTARLLQTLPAGAVPHSTAGLLRLERVLDLPAMQQLLATLGLDPDFVTALSAEQASARAGVHLSHPAWCYGQGGWVSPPQLVAQRLAQPGVHFRGGCEVAHIRRDGPEWQCLGRDGRCLGQAPHLVLANAEQALPLLAAGLHDGPERLPFDLSRSRGQVSHFDGEPVPLALPVAGDGYALPLPGGGLLCGATQQPGDLDDAVREADHRANFARLARLCGLQPPPDPARWQGRVGWRVQTADKLPLAGPMPAMTAPPEDGAPRRRDMPREPRLYLLLALGARGLTLAPLLADLVAAQVAGSPWPLETRLAQAVDPARFHLRQVRRSGG